jgi:GTP-binding protein HflX
LEETAQADLLLHVVDASSPHRDAQVEQVNKVLIDIGAGALPQVRVLNKIDIAGLTPMVERDEYGKILRVLLSARTGAGLQYLRLALNEVAAAALARNVAIA